MEPPEQRSSTKLTVAPKAGALPTRQGPIFCQTRQELKTRLTFSRRMAVLRGGFCTVMLRMVWLSGVVWEELIPSVVAMDGGQGQEGLVAFQAPELAGELESALVLVAG